MQNTTNRVFPQTFTESVHSYLACVLLPSRPGGCVSGNVLIVDDDEQVREYLSRMLQREGCTVETARDGLEALEKIRKSRFEAIVLDLVMPRVDGFGVIHYLREHIPSLLRSVIILTAVSVPQLYSQPVRRIVTKPFEVEEIAKYVRECCDAGRTA